MISSKKYIYIYVIYTITFTYSSLFCSKVNKVHVVDKGFIPTVW